MDTHEHIVSSYEEELSSLNNKIAKMGGLAEQVLGQSIDALEGRDPDLAATTIQEDEEIDLLEKEIEEQAIVMIARRQPLAYDLRQIMAALRISTELERIGDLGKNIAKRALAVVGEQQPKQLMLGLKHMGELALGQLKEVLDAYIERDADRALKVWYRDEDIDAMYNSLFRELLTYMMEDPRNIGLCTPSAVRGQEHRARRRSCDQHRRDGLFPRARESDYRPAAEKRQYQFDAGPLEICGLTC